MNFEIKSRYSGAILFALECGSLKLCVEAAVKSGADLSGAYLSGADLSGAYLSGAYLRSAYLSGADLSGADLSGADLRGADLRGALVDGGKLVGTRPVLQIGPLGSRSDYLLAFLTEKGIRVRAGCFSGSLDEFSKAVERTHADNEHAREYVAAIQMIEAYASIWSAAERPTPRTDAAQVLRYGIRYVDAALAKARSES